MPDEEQVLAAARLLQRHNRWRRGDEDLTMTDPVALGKAIDTAVAYIMENLSKKH